MNDWTIIKDSVPGKYPEKPGYYIVYGRFFNEQINDFNPLEEKIAEYCDIYHQFQDRNKYIVHVLKWKPRPRCPDGLHIFEYSGEDDYDSDNEDAPLYKYFGCENCDEEIKEEKPINLMEGLAQSPGFESMMNEFKKIKAPEEQKGIPDDAWMACTDVPNLQLPEPYAQISRRDYFIGCTFSYFLQLYHKENEKHHPWLKDDEKRIFNNAAFEAIKAADALIEALEKENG